MTFQIHALPADDFAPLWEMTEVELATQNACRMTVDSVPGFPCRISLDDAPVGEEVILVNHVSLGAATPFRASHAVFVRKDVPSAVPAPGDVPPALARRFLSIRAFDARGMMRDADVVDGGALAPALETMFADDDVAEVHIHNAKQGCFAARATRA